jgi:16S rRNA (cytidine1402-2'-O)-methyltransferase
LPADKFAFLGFLPEKAGEKKAFLQRYQDCDLTLCFHSAPQDVDKDIKAMYEVFGERKACAVREITKIHEEARSFTLSGGLDGEKRGEYILVVEGAEKKANPLNALSEREHILHYINKGMDKKEALKAAAKDRGVSKSELYPFSIDL